MSRHRVVLCLAVVLLVSLLAPGAGSALGRASAYEANLTKIDPTLLAPVQGDAPAGYSADRAFALAEDVTALVQLKDLASPQWRAAGHDVVVDSLQAVAWRSQAPVADLVRARGGLVLHQFWLSNLMLVSASPAVLREIAQNPLVEAILPNGAVTLPPMEESTAQPAQNGSYEWNIARIEAPEAWALGIRGDGARICVTDTGIDPSAPDLAGRLFTTDIADPYYPGGWAEFDSGGNLVSSTPHDTPSQGVYHGTHVSGIIAGDSYTGSAIGVAPGASLMMALILPYGGGTDAQVVAGMEWCVNPTDRFGNPTGYPAHVLSMSWGGPSRSTLLLDAIRNALLSGVIPVASAGNAGEGFVGSPGDIWGAFAVGATDVYDNVPYWSSGGYIDWPSPPSDWPFMPPYPAYYIKPDFSAPGDNILSTQPGVGYAYLSGTSMAAPHVSATVGLMVQASGFSITAEQAYQNLQRSAVDFGAPGQDTRYGYGRIDAYRAVLYSLTRNTGVEGTVYDNRSLAPLGGVRVEAQELGASVVTQDNGTFRMGLPEGNYNITFSKFGYYSQAFPIEIRLQNGTLAGFVSDANGSALPGAEIDVLEAGQSVLTDASGYYELSLKPQTYTVYASAPSLLPENRSVDVAEGATAWANFTLYADIPATLSGTVTDALAAPVASALVWVECPTGTVYQVLTDGLGTYSLEISSADTGVLTVAAFKGGYWPDRRSVFSAPGMTVVTDLAVSASNPANVAVYQDWGGELAALLAGAGYNAIDFQSPDALDLKWSLSAFSVVYWSGFTDLNVTDVPTPTTFLDILSLADALGVSIVFADSYADWPYGITLLNMYTGDPAGRFYEFDRGGVYFLLQANHPLFQGVGTAGDVVYVIQPTGGAQGDGDFTWFWNYTGTPLALVGSNQTGLMGDGIAVRDRPGGTEWVLLGSLAPQVWTHVSNDWLGSAKRIATNAVTFGANHSWATGASTGATAARQSAPTGAAPSALAGSAVAPLSWVNLTVYLDPMPSGFLSGNVTDTSGNALADVRVDVTGTPISTLTDAGGHYTMTVPIGTWNLTASRFGYVTGTATAEVAQDATTFVDFALTPMRRVGIMYDDTNFPLESLLESTGLFAVAQFSGNWDNLINAVSGLDAIILNGQVYGAFPTQAQFQSLLAAAESNGVGILFLDNVLGYGSPNYVIPWGLSLLVQYTGNPATRGEIPTCSGYPFQEITASHAITKGFNVGEIRQMENLTSCMPWSWFGGFGGTTIGRIWGGTSEPVTDYGTNLGFEITVGGSRWALMGGYGVVAGYGIAWGDVPKRIFLNAALWASMQGLNLTLDPGHGIVGSSAEFAGAGAPPNADLELLYDASVMSTLAADDSGAFSGTLAIPESEYGVHLVTVQTVGGLYAGYQEFSVDASISVTPAESPPSTSVVVEGHGFPANAGVSLRFVGLSVGDAVTTSLGSFLAPFAVPSLRGGDYVVSAEEPVSGVVASTAFRLVEGVVLSVTPSVGALHFPGEVVDIYVLVTQAGVAVDATVLATLWAPDGTSQNLTLTEVERGLYKTTFVLPGDALSGTYALVASASLADPYHAGNGSGLATFLLSPTLTSGLATIVSISEGVATVQTTLGTMRLDLDSIDARVASIEGTTATIQTSLGLLTANVSALDARVVSLAGSVATIQTSLGLLTANVSALDAKITDVQNGIATVQTTLGTIQASLVSLDGKITGLQGTVATVSTTVGSIETDLAALEARITAIENGVATIQTSLGTVQASLSDINAKIVEINGDIATIQTDLGTTQARVSDLSTTGGTVTMSAAAIAAVFSAAGVAVGLLLWRVVRKRNQP